MASAYRSPAQAQQVQAWCRAALAEWLVPHESHLIETTSGQTNVVCAGVGDRGCVYLPGTNFNAASSTVVLSALASRCRVYAADLPGQPGLSAPGRPDDELTGYATWVTELIEWVRGRHGDGQLLLAGHSRGAAVGLSADPVTVDGLALVNPGGLTGVRPSLPMLRATVPWLLRRNDAGSRRLLDYMSGPGHVPSDALVEWMTLVTRACRTTGAPGPLPERELVRWRGHRVCVAVGDHDAFFPSDRLSESSRALLGVDPVVVRRAGHLLVDEEPELVADLITGLFSRGTQV
ncbi:MAG: alpha/beta hydrolase [Marmoricola sp.]